MRRLLALLFVIGLIQFAAGCRHVAGGCDCEHASAGAACAPAAAPATPK